MAVLAGIAVTVPVLVLGRPAPAEVGTGGRAHAVATAYASWNPKTQANEYRVYDRSSGQYVTTPWRTFVVASVILYSFSCT